MALHFTLLWLVYRRCPGWALMFKIKLCKPLVLLGAKGRNRGKHHLTKRCKKDGESDRRKQLTTTSFGTRQGNHHGLGNAVVFPTLVGRTRPKMANHRQMLLIKWIITSLRFRGRSRKLVCAGAYVDGR